MSRLNQNNKSDKEVFLEEWSFPYYNGFSYWSDYLKMSLTFCVKESELLKDKIETFDKKHEGKLYDAGEYGMLSAPDGLDQYWDEIEFRSKIYPLVLIGCYTDFESELKKICTSLKGISNIIDSFNGKYIHHCKEYLDLKVQLVFSNTLQEKWEMIINYRELRNIFAHNDNPVNLEKGDFRLCAVKNIKRVDTTNNFVTIEDKVCIEEFITLCDEFINQLINELANKIYDSNTHQ